MDNSQLLKLSLSIEPMWCNHWPCLKIICNDKIYWEGSLESQTQIDIDIPLENNNELRIQHFDKKFGENNIWDTQTFDGKIIQDRAFKITSLAFNDVDIVKHIMRFPFVKDDGSEMRTDYFGFNGDLIIKFRNPVYEWIIEDLVRPTTGPDSAPDFIIETSHNNLFDYDQDLVEIKKIKSLLKEYAHLFS